MKSHSAAMLLLTVAALAPACDEHGSRLLTRRTSYTEEEITFRNPEDGIHLNGTLTLPDRPGPFAAVVLVAGSGPHNRDLEIGKHRPFLTLADYLSRHGVVVLRYDKRGCGRSGGEFEPFDIENFVDDALAGISFLETHEAIDPSRIGALGISQGGLIVPLMATRSSKVDFIVMMAAPGVWGKEFFCLSSVAIARASGYAERDFDRIRELYDEFYPFWAKATLSTSETTQATTLLREIAGFMDAETRKIFHLDDVDSYLAFMRSQHVRESLDHDPAEVLKRVRCPVLAITGSKDVQVAARENLAAIEAALREGGNRDFRVAELEGLNHMFQPCRTGLPGEYFSSRKSIAPEVMDTIADWILTVTAPDKRL